ncbi:protein disulfide isomerase-like 1-4 [Sesamum indicum]|uniref:Protein disulfide-isomerase n=1 Tax=Sesamum indicum TaxID=4182 RepID=A0A6I9TWA3_SESIN|nr:protein disulfide isomerase-like 1-4 [Sesamum indicum]
MAPTRLLLLLALLSLLLFSLLPTPILSDAAADDDEDLNFLEELESDDIGSSHQHHHSDAEYSDNDGEEDENYDDFEVPSDFNHQDEEDEVATFDEKDVIVLMDGNFSDFVDENKYVMVEFYAPWCGHCKALAPEYAAAATELKGENVKLAKVDATEENELAEKYEVQGFPTLYFFVDGEHKPYSGQRTKDAIVTWIKKKIGPGVSNITTTEDAERILTSENKVILGFLDSLVGPDSEELAAASKLDNDVNFYQTANPNVAKMFHLEADVKRPALVLLKKEAEKVTHFDGQFKKSVIAEFVSANKLPLVVTFSRENAPLIFESTIKKQLLLFATSNDSQGALQTFQEAAKLFKGKLIFVYVQVDNEDVGKPVADYFGVAGDSPKVLGYAANDETKKYILDGEVTHEKIKAFGEAFLEDKLKPFYKSDPVPVTNDGDVKIIVGNNFDDIVLDESKDVLLEIYAPWCGHCQALEPTYNKLAKHLRGIESLVIAKMDGTTNEHPRAKADGFPTILFFSKTVVFLIITVDTDRTVVAFYKFLKKHASIPFKLQKAGSSPMSEDSHTKEGIKSSTSDVKDEL